MMTTERFYVKGSRIKQRGVDGWFTVDEVCQLLNNQQNALIEANADIFRLCDLLRECESEFRRYDGRKLFDLEYVVYAEILNKISEVLDPK